MMRHLFNLFAGASLFLCIAVAVLWARSYWRMDTLIWGGEDRPTRILSSTPGRISGAIIDGVTHDQRFEWRINGVEGQSFPDPAGSIAGFYFAKGSITLKIHPGMPSMRTWAFQVPYWCPTLLATIAPIIGLVRYHRRRYRRRPGVCPSCGYDLRATPGRCPECGEVPISG
jgi:hypothetical protein